MERYREIERSIIKKYRKDIWAKFVKAVKDYKLIEENDKIMVCISGGKDSFLLAKCLEELKRHGKFNFELYFEVMNPGYSEVNKNLILENAKTLNLDIDMFESDIFEIVDTVDRSPCYLCARMRRGCLYKKAQELGCNKIALGHHFNDVIETTMLSMLYGAEIKTMMPKLHSENLDIKDGEIHAIMGPNGTGKSTLSKVILWVTKIIKYKSGDIFFNGESIKIYDCR